MVEETKTLAFRESRSRSLVKSLVYRVLSIGGTAVISWIITRDIKEMISITLAVQVFLITLYYFYERVWDKINWGREIGQI